MIIITIISTKELIRAFTGVADLGMFCCSSTSQGKSHCRSIVNVGKLSREDVMVKYQSSTLVFPSYLESFGYPLAEARMMGAIVLAADTPFSREILDGYENAHFFPFDMPERLAELMEAVVKGEIVRKNINRAEHKGIHANGWIQVMQYIYQMVRK